MPDNLQILYDRFINDTATPGEVMEFWTLLQQSAEDHPIRESVFMLYQDKVPAELENKDWAPSMRRIFNKDRKVEGILVKMRRNFTKIAVAASVILTLGVGSYFLFFNNKEEIQIVKTKVPNDVKAPASNRAMITLANGQTVELDSVTNGTLATQGDVRVTRNANGEIVYSGTSSSASVTYNTLYNPRGSQVVNIILQDGSKVWLNAESSLKYPVAFIGNDRRIEITGEAYFEVAHNATKKFLVYANGVTTEVMGTHFNVNSYPDEGDIKVTLLEGSVKVSTDHPSPGSPQKAGQAGKVQSVVIKPGQQAQLLTTGHKLQTVNADVEQEIAWKNGMFIYKGADLQTIMRQVARWYDVEIVFEKEVKEKFYADVSRNTNVSSLFKMLETTKAVHFKIEGKKVTVMP